MMQRVAFKMILNPGCKAEYKKRHDALWPELAALLKQKGIADYSIFLDEQTHELTGYLRIEDATLLDELPEHPVMQKWWNYMKDIMYTHADHSPVTRPLEELFYMP